MPKQECEICEGGGTADAFMRRTVANVLRYGRSIVGVTGIPPFSYTVGHRDRGDPDLLIVGLHHDNAGRLLNAIGDLMAKEDWTYPRDVDLGGAFPARLRPVRDLGKAQEEYTCVCTGYYGDNGYRVLQVVLCDQAGRWPGDPLCAEPYASQVML